MLELVTLKLEETIMRIFAILVLAVLSVVPASLLAQTDTSNRHNFGIAASILRVNGELTFDRANRVLGPDAMHRRNEYADISDTATATGAGVFYQYTGDNSVAWHLGLTHFDGDTTLDVLGLYVSDIPNRRGMAWHIGAGPSFWRTEGFDPLPCLLLENFCLGMQGASGKMHTGSKLVGGITKEMDSESTLLLQMEYYSYRSKAYTFTGTTVSAFALGTFPTREVLSVSADGYGLTIGLMF